MNGLKESREKAGLSQQALADMLHINQALNVSVDFLLNEEVSLKMLIRYEIEHKNFIEKYNEVKPELAIFKGL